MLGSLLQGLELSQECKSFFVFNFSPVCGVSTQRLCGGANSDLLQEDLGHMPCLPGRLLRGPLSPWQGAAHHACAETLAHSQGGRLSLLWRSLLLSLGPGVHRDLFASSKSLGVRFDFKTDCAPPAIFLPLLLCSWTQSIFLGDSNILLLMVVQ